LVNPYIPLQSKEKYMKRLGQLKGEKRLRILKE